VHSRDAVLWTIMRWNAACVKSSDTSVDSTTWPVSGNSHKGKKSVLIMMETSWKNYLNFGKDKVNFNIIACILSEKKKGITFVSTLECWPSNHWLVICCAALVCFVIFRDIAVSHVMFFSFWALLAIHCS